MGVLVEDLLTLARLGEVRDRPARPWTWRALAADAAADARATDPGATIAARADGDGDRARRPAISSARCSRTWCATRSCTPARARRSRWPCARDGDGQVELEVRDHGPGLPDGDPDALFERFCRAEPGRERGGPAPAWGWRSWPGSCPPTGER